MAGCGPMEIRREASWKGSGHVVFQLSKNGVQAVYCRDVPSQGQYIAPMTLRMKQSLEQNVVGFRKSLLELRKPTVSNGRDGFRSSQHSRSQAIDLRRVSREERCTPGRSPHRVLLCPRQP